MSRENIFRRLRPSKPRDPQNALDRLNQQSRNLIPARGLNSNKDTFIFYATQSGATLDTLESLEQIPEKTMEFLSRHNLAAQIRLAPDPVLQELPWPKILEVSSGPARDADQTSLTSVVAAIAETGSLLVASSSRHPSTLNILPENHLVLLKSADIVGCYEDAYDRLQGQIPRTMTLITGPSRTGDIELKIQLGAHGPRRLHILLLNTSHP